MSKNLSQIGKSLVTLGEKFESFIPKNEMEYDFIKKLNQESKREDQIESWFPDAGALIYQAFQDHSFKLDGRLVSIIG